MNIMKKCAALVSAALVALQLGAFESKRPPEADRLFRSESVEAKIAEGPDENGVDLSHFLKNWEDVIQEEADAGAVIIADSLEDMARKLGYEPEKFLADVEAYNKALLEPRKPMMPMMFMGDGDGPDPEEMMAMMAKRMGPPATPVGDGKIYAIKLIMFHENSMGGMVIDKNANVLKDGKPIPGLFASGDTTRGVMVPGDVGVQYIESVFTALTYAFNSGYLSCVEAAKYALS